MEVTEKTSERLVSAQRDWKSFGLSTSSEERQEEACGLTEFSVLLLCECVCVCVWWMVVVYWGGGLEASTHIVRCKSYTREQGGDEKQRNR